MKALKLKLKKPSSSKFYNKILKDDSLFFLNMEQI